MDAEPIAKPRSRPFHRGRPYAPRTLGARFGLSRRLRPFGLFRPPRPFSQLTPRGLSMLFCLVALAAAGGLVASRPAEAAVEEARRYRGWRVGGFEIKGAPDGLEGDLTSGLSLAGKRHLLFWRKYPDLDPDAVVEDLARSRLFLARHGFPSARIEPTFAGKPDDKEVEVTFEVDAGPEVRVAENRTVAFPPALDPQAEEILELEEGERFSDRKVEERVAELLRVLKENGYAYATVHSRLTRPDSTQVEVEFVVDAGEVCHFGPTSVGGISSDLEEVAQRTIGIPEGSRYSPEKLEAANQNLRLLDLFRRIRVYTEPAGGNRLDVVADLAERKMQSVNLRAGYWTEDRLRLGARYRHRNILTEGRGLGLDGTYSRFLQEASATYWRPTLFHSRTRGSVTLRGRRESEPSYLLRTAELELAATYIPSVRTSLRPALTLSLIDIEARTDPPTFEDPEPNLISASVQWVREELDDRLSPMRGQRRAVRLEAGLPGFEPRRNYLLLEPEQAFYVPLVENRLTLATRVAVGLTAPRRDAAFFLPNKRFFAGGASSVRGFERRRLGPLDDDGRPIGGVARAEGSVELRFPLVWRLVGAAFADAGQVWRHYEEVEARDLRFAVGPGLGLNTPIGPVRADVGFPLGHRRASEPRAVFHLSIGNAF